MEFRRGKEEHEKRVQQLQVQLDDETEQQRPCNIIIRRFTYFHQLTFRVNK